jgi:hypothetical protein
VGPRKEKILAFPMSDNAAIMMIRSRGLCGPNSQSDKH